MVGEVLKTSCRLSEACGGSRAKYPEPVVELFNFEINMQMSSKISIDGEFVYLSKIHRQSDNVDSD